MGKKSTDELIALLQELNTANEKGCWEMGFTQGYMCAVANLMKNHAEDSYCIELISESGISLVECRKQGVVPYDLEVLEPLYREIARKKRMEAHNNDR